MNPHQWCYLCEAAIDTPGGGRSYHRLEMCMEYGVVRIKLGDSWYYSYPRSAEELKTTKAKDTYLGGDAWEVGTKQRRSRAVVLGRGLEELLSQSTGAGALKLLQGGNNAQNRNRGDKSDSKPGNTKGGT